RGGHLVDATKQRLRGHTHDHAIRPLGEGRAVFLKRFTTLAHRSAALALAEAEPVWRTHGNHRVAGRRLLEGMANCLFDHIRMAVAGFRWLALAPNQREPLGMLLEILFRLKPEPGVADLHGTRTAHPVVVIPILELLGT